MSTKHLASLVAAAMLGLVLTLSLRTAPVAAETTAQPACGQWEISSDDLAVTTSTEVPELGKPVVKRAPAGWEPFAIGPSGVLAYRRCVK